MMMCHSKMEAAHIILIAVYDDGLLITIDGKSYFHHQTSQHGSRTDSQITRGEAEVWRRRLKESPPSLGVLVATIVGFSIMSLRVAGL